MLDGILEDVRGGKSRVLVVRGEPGVGKSALFEYVVERAAGCRVARAVGVQSEMELAFAGLHQLCRPMLDHAERIPPPQREALRTAFGLDSGVAPDRFLVALAVLSLLSEVAEERPLICVVDDEHWLDRASAQAIAFVARRLEAESVGLLLATRRPSHKLAGLPELVVCGLREDDARALLDAVLTWPVDARVREQIVSETQGNPLALLELADGLTPEELAGGFAFAGAVPVSRRLDASFRRRLNSLPAETRRLMRLAAADPVGEPLLLFRAAETLGIGAEAAAPAAEAGLLEIGARVRFRHPLARAAAYRSASPEERRAIHAALAEATDPEIDPDRRAWHRAKASAGPDERVARELERCAGRARARGGLGASAAFRERAAMLTPEPTRRAERLLDAAREKRDAGALDAALGLLVALEAGALGERQRAGMDLLRGQIALQQRRGADAGRLLVSAAGRLESLDGELARETRLEALVAALVGDLELPGGAPEFARAVRGMQQGGESQRAIDVLLDAFAARLTDGYAAAAPKFSRALELLLDLDGSAEHTGRWLFLADGRASVMLAMELWDADAFHRFAARQVQFARRSGALVQLQFALNFLVRSHLLAGELSAASLVIDEVGLIAEVTGHRRLATAEMMLAAWRGREEPAVELIEARSHDPTSRGWTVNATACAALNNGLGRYDIARDAAWRAFERDPIAHGPFLAIELAEAASRTGDKALVRAALEWVAVRTPVIQSAWALGIEARIRALLSEGEAADGLHRESIEHLGRTRLRVEVARAHLLYGEWLRRERRRVDARKHLRSAYEMLGAMGVEGFAERARRELVATGETIRTRAVESRDDLTAQEAQIARLARDGLSNPEIGARLFISPHTVRYHLHKVFTKLGISSREQLDRVLPAGRPPGAATDRN